MPTFTFKKNLFLPILLFSFFAANAQRKAGNAVETKQNFKTFTNTVKVPDEAWMSVNKDYTNHPDARFVSTTEVSGMVEVLGKRTKDSKYFVDIDHPGKFSIAKGSDALHMQKDGQWITIDSRLASLGNGVYEASRQNEPVGIDARDKVSYIKSAAGKISFNNWTLHGTRNGSNVLLATANWANYTAGDNGISIINIFPGIDAEISVTRGALKTNFIVHSNQFAGYDQLSFQDVFKPASGSGMLAFSSSLRDRKGVGEVDLKVAGKNVLHIDKANAFLKGNPTATFTDLPYTIADNRLQLTISADYLNRHLQAGDVIIDPQVSTIATLAQASITGGMNCGSFTNSCNFVLPVTPPAGATITKVYNRFSVGVTSPVNNGNAFFMFSINGNCAGYYTIPGSTSTAGFGTKDTLLAAIGFDSITSTVMPCMPAPSCTPAPINFTLSLFNTYCGGGTACNSTYMRATEPYVVIVQGYTFEPKKIVRSSDTAVCLGTSVTLTRSASFGVPPYRYSWAPGGQTTASITVTPLVTTTYTSTITDSCGNSVVDTTTVQVVNQTVAPAVVSPQTVCQYGNVPLTAGGTNLRWWATATGGVASSIAPVPPNVPGTYNYYVSSQTKCGETPRAHIEVTVLPKPAPPTIVSPLGVCQYAQVQLTATGQNLKWYVTPTGSVGQPVMIPNTNYVDSYYYYVSQTINGCESDRARLRLDVNYKPNGIILASRLFVCEGDTASFKYYGNALPDAYYNWSLTGPVFNEIVSGQGTQGPLIIRFDSSGLRQVRVQVNNRGCLSDIATQSLSVRPNPKIAYVAKQEACQHEVINVALNAISPLIDSFHYSFPGAQIVYGASSGGPYGITYHNPGQYVISSMSYARECPSRFYYDTITVRPLPDARFTVSSNQICAGDSILFTARNTDSNTQFYWTPDNFFSSGNIYRSWGVVKNNAYIRLRAVSRYGCVATDSVFIKADACCDLYFPNAFSPNKDGKNDIFRPVTLGHQEIKTFRVVNRWGQVVFETRGDRIGWDGTYNGKEQDAGTYFYYIRYRCNDSREDLEQKGEVILVR